jgi:hypothetical protein
MNKQFISRRALVKSSIFGILAVSIPSITYAKSIYEPINEQNNKKGLSNRYPAIDDEMANEVVGKSHFDLDRVMELVDKRPELSRATWDWGFGDWESAIGAASHVGRRDIVEYLLSKGAKANIFTFAVLGAYETVKSMIEFYPSIQENYGPHGISLLQHANAGLRMQEKMSSEQISNSKKLISYLENLGNADGVTFLDEPQDKELYLGDYKYGEGENEGFSVKLNMRKMLTFGSIGNFGGTLYKVKDHEFRYNKFPTVSIGFQFENDKVISVTVKEPDLTLVAHKV